MDANPLERKIDQLAFQSVTIAEANDVQTYDLHAVRIRHLTHYHLMLLSLTQKSRRAEIDALVAVSIEWQLGL